MVARWRYDYGDGHVRGVDLFTVRDGLVAEKLSYVKGLSRACRRQEGHLHDAARVKVAFLTSPPG